MNTAHPEQRDAVLVSEQVQSTGDGSAGASVLDLSLNDIRAPVYRLKTMAMLSAMGHIQNGCIGPEKDCTAVANGLNVTQSDIPVRDIGAPTSTPDGTCTVLDGATAALTLELPTPTLPAEAVGDQNSGEGMHEASPVRDSSVLVDQKPESLPSVTTSGPSVGDSLAVVTVPSHAPVPATVLLESSDDSGTSAPETLTLTLTLNVTSEGNARAIGRVPEIERGNKRLHDDVSPENSTDGVSSVANDKSQSEPSAALECTATSVAEPAEADIESAIIELASGRPKRRKTAAETKPSDRLRLSSRVTRERSVHKNGSLARSLSSGDKESLHKRSRKASVSTSAGESKRQRGTTNLSIALVAPEIAASTKIPPRKRMGRPTGSRAAEQNVPKREPVREAIRKINQTAKTLVDDTATKPGGSAIECKKQPKKIAVHKTKKEVVATQGKRTGGKITMAPVTMAKGEGVKRSYTRKEMDQDSAAKALDASETVVSKKPFRRTDKPAEATDRDIDLSAESGEGSSTTAQTTAHEQKKALSKSYLCCGIYTDQVAPGKKLTKKELALKKPTEREVLPFPIYYGLDILYTQEAFTLPYDVYCASQSHALAPRAVPPPPYKKINRNIYADVPKPSLKERQAIVDDAICSCAVPSVPADGAGQTAELTGCGEDCVNRSTFTECSPMTCPVASICTNNRFQTNMVPCKLDVFDTNSKGYGVRCKSDIKRGALIAEYVGEIVSETECRRRMTERYKHMNNFYFLHHTGNNVIDGCQYGSAARFINHSCSPNAHIEKWTVKGLVRVGIFASTAIARGTEISYDYKYRVMGQGNVVCRCGSDNCSGFLGERPKKMVSMATGSHKKGRRKGNAAKSAKLTFAGEEPVLEVSLAQQRRNQARDFTYARKNRLFLVRNIPSHKLVPLDDLQAGRFGTANPDSRTNGLILGTTRNLAQNSTGRNSAMGRHGDVGRHSGTISSASGVHLTVNTDYKQLVRIMRMIYTTVLKTVREQCRLFLRLPPRSRYPDYYQLIDTPICLADIEQRINSGLYPTVEELQADFALMRNNAHKYNKRTSEIYKYATVVFEQVRSTIRDHGDKIQEIMYGVWTGAEPADSPSNETAAIDNTEIASSENTENAATGTTVKDENKPGYILRNGTDTSVTDVIQCVCQLNVNEGCMLQCSGCLVWLHDTCVQLTPEQAADDSFDFVCAECLQVSPSEFLVVPNEYTDDDEERHNTYYRYLVRDGAHYRQGLCVYVPANTHKRSSSRTAHQNIIRIAQIWTTPDGQAYVSGSRHYRPWETRHKINHRFGKQEVVKSNTTIVAKVDDLLGCCAVMSSKDYIEGKVYDIAERDTYYVEWRYDPDYAQWKKIRKHDFAEHHTDLCSYEYRVTPADTTRYILNGSEFVEPPTSTKSKGKSSPKRGNGGKANDALRPKKGPAKVSNANVNTHTSKRGASREGRSGSSVPETGTAPDTTTSEGAMANKIVGCTTAVRYTTAERGAAHMSHDDKKEAMESILDSLALEVDEDIRKVSVDVSFLLVGSRRRCGNRS